MSVTPSPIETSVRLGQYMKAKLDIVFTLKQKVPIMDTIILKFGGSSVANNIKLNIVAKKIIDVYEKQNNVLVLLSAGRKNYR